MTTTTTIPTRKAEIARLTALGVEGAALDAIIKETAPARHAARVEAAKTAAEEYFLSQSGMERDECDSYLGMAAAAICWLDIMGVGGRDGVGGDGTDRHPAFRECGKGRKKATDGDAWTAAIGGALALLPAGRFVVDSSPDDHPEHIPTIAFTSPVTGGAYAAIDDWVAPAGWLMTLTREGLRRSLGLSPWFPAVPMHCPPESARGWATLVNYAAPAPQGPPPCLDRY